MTSRTIYIVINEVTGKPVIAALDKSAAARYIGLVTEFTVTEVQLMEES